MQKKVSFVEMVEHFVESDGFVLPVFSSAAMQVQQELTKKEPDMKVVFNIISGDQSISTKVLQMANSSFYRGLVEVTTLQTAIVRLGMAEIGRISLLAATKNQFRTNVNEHKQVMKKLWQHSIGCAIGSKWIARRCELEELEGEAFFAGLFHDVGKLVVLMVVEQLKRRKKDIVISGSLLVEAMGSLHCLQGYNLMKKWNIPEKYCIVARDHHSREFNEKDLLINTVRLADMVCNKLRIGVEDCYNDDIGSSDEATSLNLSEIDIAELEILLEDTKVLAA